MIENSYNSAGHQTTNGADPQAWLQKSAAEILALKNTSLNADNLGSTGQDDVEDKTGPPKPKLHANPTSKVEEFEQEEATLVISLVDNMTCLASILKMIEVSFWNYLENPKSTTAKINTLLVFSYFPDQSSGSTLLQSINKIMWLHTCQLINLLTHIFREVVNKNKNKIFQEANGTLAHMESRPSRQEDCQFDVMIKLQINWSELANLLKVLRNYSSIHVVNVISTQGTVVKG